MQTYLGVFKIFSNRLIKNKTKQNKKNIRYTPVTLSLKSEP